MNQKELNELRRRFRLDKNNFSRVYGCYVNSNKEIIAWVDTSMGLMRQEEQEMYLGLLKKSLSGTLGKNLIDVVFSTQQVADSDEHRLLQTLRQTELKDPASRETLCRQIIDCIDMGETNYLILLAADAYDVPHRSKDDEIQADASSEVFKYFVCSICPVKAPTLELRYDLDQSEFHSSSTGYIATSPSSTPRSTTARRTFTMCCSTRKTPRRSIRRSSTRCSTSTRRCLPRSRKTPLARRLPTRSTRIAATMSSSPCTSRSERASKITRRAKTPSRLK